MHIITQVSEMPARQLAETEPGGFNAIDDYDSAGTRYKNASTICIQSYTCRTFKIIL